MGLEENAMELTIAIAGKNERIDAVKNALESDKYLFSPVKILPFSKESIEKYYSKYKIDRKISTEDEANGYSEMYYDVANGTLDEEIDYDVYFIEFEEYPGFHPHYLEIERQRISDFEIIYYLKGVNFNLENFISCLSEKFSDLTINFFQHWTRYELENFYEFDIYKNGKIY